MEVVEFKTKEDILEQLVILRELYPNMSRARLSEELDKMIPHNYGMIGVFEDNVCLGVTGYWIGTKLWCGKYLELDNVIVSKKSRSKGVGKLLFEHMKQKAMEENCTMLALDSYTDNFPAHKFFYREGFIPRGFHFIQILNKNGIRDERLGT